MPRFVVCSRVECLIYVATSERPVLELQSLDGSEVGAIPRDKNRIRLQRRTRNSQIHRPDAILACPKSSKPLCALIVKGSYVKVL